MSSSIVQDIAIYVLPINIVWNLQMPKRQKIALGSLLCVGLVAVAGAFALPSSHAKSTRLTVNSRLRPLLLRTLPRERKGYLVLHDRLPQLV